MMDESSIRSRMESTVNAVREDISSIRTGRATPSLVEGIEVTTYNGASRLKVVELATLSAPDPRTILITPWDKATLFDIKRAIEESKSGFSVVSGEGVLRINLPPMTEEDRQSYIRLLGQKLENGRIIVRRVRQEAMEEVRAAFDRREFGEDEKFQREERIQKLTDEYVGKIEEMGKQKEAELLSV